MSCRRIALLTLTLPVAMLAACGEEEPAQERPVVTLPAGPPSEVTAMTTEVVATYPHDSDAFTQGLLVDSDGRLVETTGHEGESNLRIVDLDSGDVQDSVDLSDDMFGEGVAQVDDTFVYLSWQNGIATVFDRNTLEQVGTHPYQGEGWGLCNDGERLVMSNGSAALTFRDPASFDPIGSVDVTLNGAPVFSLNELDCTGNLVWANVWQTDTIVGIDPTTGKVTSTVDASALLTPEERSHADVLNGIAAVPGKDTFYVTGKDWPKLCAVRFVPAPADSSTPDSSTTPT